MCSNWGTAPRPIFFDYESSVIKCLSFDVNEWYTDIKLCTLQSKTLQTENTVNSSDFSSSLIDADDAASALMQHFA